MSLPIGSQKITADGIIGASGKKIRVYMFIVNADSSGATVQCYDGTSTGGTKLDTLTGAASVSSRVGYPGGLLFNSGCYLDIDAHTNFVTVIYEQENS